MGKMIIVFLVMTFFFAGIIHLFQASTKKDIWKLTKLLGYSILCSLLTIASLTTIVVLF
jgi:hypothetical protein